MLFFIPTNGGLGHQTLIAADQLAGTKRTPKTYTRAELDNASVLLGNQEVSLDVAMANRDSIVLVPLN